ncbi:MAG: ATP-binding protein [Stomatobaculum sp.]|nr:ATP-binding protein [Stomatobaculum sp.]
MKELRIKASLDNLDEVLQFVDQELEGADCSMKAMMQIDLAVEEIFVNIASYAYAPGTGEALIRLQIAGEPRYAEICFQDSGIPYDPLAKDDPDVTLAAEQRDIGGLGIFMAKKSVDDIRYEYRDGYNVLTIRKYI